MFCPLCPLGCRGFRLCGGEERAFRSPSPLLRFRKGKVQAVVDGVIADLEEQGIALKK